MIRVRLNNNDQLWHLYQALRGHCEVEMVPDSEGPVLEIPSTTGPSSAAVLRRLDGWLSEFGVESIALELDGRPYVLNKGAGQAAGLWPGCGSGPGQSRSERRERRLGISARGVGRRVLRCATEG